MQGRQWIAAPTGRRSVAHLYICGGAIHPVRPPPIDTCADTGAEPVKGVAQESQFDVFKP